MPTHRKVGVLVLGGLLSCMAALTSCTNTEWAHFKSLGNNAKIKCWSGGVVIYEGTSDGKVMNASNSDGYEFMDSADHKLTQVSGNCVIKY